ncbi:MAG: HAD family hydrolase [Pseudomonadota bacterium]
MPVNPSPAAIVFDMDGTLLDTEPLYTKASQAVLDEYGETYTPELKRQCMGGDSHTSAQIVIDAFGLPLTSDEYLARREVHLIELFRACPEIAGAGTFVTQLHAAGITFGLATSSHQHLCELKLARKPWGNLFKATVCGDHPALRRGKPAPDIFLLCAEALGVPPDGCIAFEDSRNGILAARAAGMDVIAINSPFVGEGDLADANMIIDSYGEAAALVDQWAKRG